MIEKIKWFFLYDSDKYENCLDDENCKWWVIVNKLISFSVLLFVILLMIESVQDYSIVFQKEFFIFDACISMVLAWEYIYRLLRSHSKINFFIYPIRIVDLLSFLPFFLWFVVVWDFLKVLRLLRVLRILRFVRKIPLTAGFIKSLRDYIDEYKAVFILFMVILFLWSFLVYFVEKDVLWTKFTSIPMTLWWGLVTMTTVGFWDIYPTSMLWRLFWSILVFLGPLVLALVSAVTIMVFMETTENQKSLSRHRRSKECIRCETRNVKTAHYCVNCGKKFITKHPKT
jgi:voltage-gated potassium channel